MCVHSPLLRTFYRTIGSLPFFLIGSSLVPTQVGSIFQSTWIPRWRGEAEASQFHTFLNWVPSPSRVEGLAPVRGPRGRREPCPHGWQPRRPPGTRHPVRPLGLQLRNIKACCFVAAIIFKLEIIIFLFALNGHGGLTNHLLTSEPQLVVDCGRCFDATANLLTGQETSFGE